MSIFKYIENLAPFGIENQENQEKLIESFLGIGGGNKQTLNARLKSRRDMTQNTSISDELIMSNTNNLVNTLVNDVIVANDIFIVNSTQAVNEIIIDSVECAGDINISNIKQTNIITTEMKNEVRNKVITTIISNISTSIKDTITKQQPSKDYIGAIIDKNNAALSEFNKAGSDELQKMKDTVRAAASGFSSGGFSIGGGNSQTANVNMDLATSVAQTLGISTSVTKTSLNNITNNDAFSTKVNNFISMINNISAENMIEISKLKCGGSFNLTDIEQMNDIQATFESSFDNEVITTISKTITTNISNAYTSFYDAIDIAAQTQPEELTAKQYDLAESMHLLTLYHLCATDTPEALELKCAIEKRLIELGESNPNVPSLSDECAQFAPVVAPVVTPVVAPPVVAPPVAAPPVAAPPVAAPPVVAPSDTFSLFKPPYLYFLIGGLLFLILIVVLLLSSKKTPDFRGYNSRNYGRYDY